jgi:hypothetical protein
MTATALARCAQLRLVISCVTDELCRASLDDRPGRGVSSPSRGRSPSAASAADRRNTDDGQTGQSDDFSMHLLDNTTRVVAFADDAAQHQAACVLQRQSRGFVARRSVERTRAERDEWRARDKAARAIQTHSRGHLAKRQVNAKRKERSDRERAATKIQQTARKRDACRRVAEAREAYLTAVRNEGASDGGSDNALVPHDHGFEASHQFEAEEDEDDLLSAWWKAFLPPRMSLAEK